MNYLAACVNSVLRRKVVENRALLGHYASSTGNFLQTFGTTYRSHPQGQESRSGPIGCPETSVRNHRYLLRNDPEERSSLI